VSREEDGGKLEEWAPPTTVKFPGDGRGCFGAAKVTPIGGDPSRGVKIEPFDYTGCNILSPEQYNEKAEAELEHVDGLPDKPWDYKVKYPQT
jgi:hypothetical protein